MNAATELLAVRDIVRLGGQFGRHELIITEVNPHKPANLYTGVKVRGQGKPYIFGLRHNPVKVGVAPENHPALVALSNRKAQRGGGPGPSADYKAVAKQLIVAVRGDDIHKARLLADILEGLG